MDDSCAVCADALEWVAYGSCGHREVCSTCVVRLRFILEDRRCCICKTESSTVFVTKALGDYTRTITDFSAFPSSASEGQVGSYWYHEGSQAYFDDVDHYRMIRAMCRLSCSVCDRTAEEKGNEAMKRRNKFKNIEQLKAHLFHKHRMVMCHLCLEGRKVFICEQKLYTRSQLSQHISSGDSEVDGSESERGGFTGHPMCQFCKTPFYGDNELYMHMSREHYTCHICQRQHPGQYEYFQTYDDLETHFRHDHFLCENEECLAKKFIVYATEAEMKRHNTIEHGGHMSRSKRNAALQLPTSFRFRRSNEQDQRRGRGRGFHPDPSGNQLSMAIEASLETATADGRARESSSGVSPASEHAETSQTAAVRGSLESLTLNSRPDPLPLSSTAAAGQSSRNFHVLEESYFPPLPDYEAPEPSSKYAQALNQGSAARLGEESFPPLPGMKEGTKPKAKQEPKGKKDTLASRLNRGNGSVKVLNSASSSQSRPSQFPGFTHHTSTSARTWGTTNQVPTSSAYPSLPAQPRIENGFASPVSANPAWNSVSANRMKHSASAPNLIDGGSSLKQPASSVVSAAVQNQVSSASSQSRPTVDVPTSNKRLVEMIRAGLGNDEGRFDVFKSISTEFRQGEINSWEYLSYIEQFGLSHLVPELVETCPVPQKKKELFDAYHAELRRNSRQENGNADSVGSKQNIISGKKGKGKSVDRSENTSAKEALADSILSTVRRMHANYKPQEGEVEVLSKDGYRTANAANLSSAGNGMPASSIGNRESLSDGISSSSSPNLNGGGEASKQRRKTSKFHRVRLGDGSAAALLDLGRSNASPERTVEETASNPSDGLLVRGAWQNQGRQRLFANTKKKPSK